MAILINLNDARKNLNELEGSAEYNKGVTDAFNALFDLPTIEAEPTKHGKWEMYGAITQGTLAIPIYRCSECKEDTNNWFWHYCPNCGAKMDLTE